MNLRGLPGNMICQDFMVLPDHVMEGGWKFSILEFVYEYNNVQLILHYSYYSVPGL